MISICFWFLVFRKVLNLVRHPFPEILSPINYREKFEAKSSYIVENAKSYSSQHRLENHISLNLLNLLQNPKYTDVFWSEVTEDRSNNLTRFLFQKTTYKMAFRTITMNNYVVDYITVNPTFS